MTALGVRPPAPATEVAPARTGAAAPWMLRVNPLAVTRTADAALCSIVERLAAAEEAVRAVAARAEDELYDQVGATTDTADRRRLVALRRAVHNDRDPQPDPQRDPEAPGAAVAEWMAARERRAGVREELAAAYPAAADREREVLAALLSEDDLRRALTLVAPEVAREAERYRAAVAADAPVPARARKSERGLLQYVTRAMVRTSPLSRFTAVGLAVPDPAGTAPERLDVTGATSFPALDQPALSYVLGGLSPAEPDPWVGPAPATVFEPETGRVVFSRPTADGAERVAAPARGPIVALLDATDMGPRRAGRVVASITEALGCTRAEAEKLVGSALATGILCTWPGPDDGTPGPPPPEVTARLDRLSDAGPAERATELSALSSDLDALGERAGRRARVLVEEDYVLPPRTVATSGWRDQLADLGAAVELESVFDWLHDIRILLTAAVVETHGPGANVPLVGSSRRLAEQVFRQMATASGTGTGDGALHALHALRRDVRDGLDARIAAADPTRPVRLSADEARAWTAGMPERLRRDPCSYGVFVQPAGDRLVVNDGLSGNGMLLSRFLDADRRLGGRALGALRERIEQRYAGTVGAPVENLGLHRLAVNVHTPVLAESLSIEDWHALRLVHDPERDDLRVEDPDGRPLRVLHLGSAHPGLLPPPVTLATALSNAGRLDAGLLDERYARSGHDGVATTGLPRVEVGGVVVARRRWYGGADLDEALASDGPCGPLPELTRWRAQHDVPDRVVVKSAFRDPPGERTGFEPSRGLRHKPQYVDLASALGTRVLPRMLDRRGGGGNDADTVLYLEEALPAPVEGTHAVEWVVEVGREPGGRFRAEDEDVAAEDVAGLEEEQR